MSDAPLSWTGLTLTALRHAQQRAPVKTGTLRRSLINWVEPGGLRGYIGSNLEYSIFVHEGTRFMAARPFLEEGIEDSRDEIAQLLQAAGDEYFKSIV
jgi:HK97 gp10 family phage protein